MFYLLEDNRIIDSNNIGEDLAFEICGYIKNDEIIYTSIYDGAVLETKKIKKQSENVFDLIDWEKDLIKVYGDICECKKQSNYRFNFLRENNVIDAIYKPDANGNYIKAWEKKGEKI